MIDGNGLLLMYGIFTEIEDASTFNNTLHSDDEIVQVSDVIDSDIDIDQGSNFDMEDLYFVVDYEDITNFCQEEDKRNFMSNNRKW